MWALAGMLMACAGSQPVATIAPVAKPAEPAPPPALRLASELPVAEWLPESSVLVARVDIVALQKTGPLSSLLEVWLDELSALLTHARRVHVGVEPVGADERVVLVIEADQPPSGASSQWTQIARDAWVGCVRACDGYAVTRAVRARPSDVREGLLAAPVPQYELAVAYAGELLDDSVPAKVALRERLLDTQVGVTSELRVATLRMTQTASTLTAELHASFTSRGVASSASLLARGAVFGAADELERVGLTREADLLYAITLTLGADDLTAKLTVPLDAVPSLAMAWLASHKSAATEAESLQQ
jgi:hypothetical protein